MATKVVKVKAHKRLDGTGKIEDVNAHLRSFERGLKSFSPSLKSVIHHNAKTGIASVINKKDGSERILAYVNVGKNIEGRSQLNSATYAGLTSGQKRNLVRKAGARLLRPKTD